MSDIIPDGNGRKVEVHKTDERYQLVLPCDVKDFRRFISSLLGKHQEEKGKFEGYFHVEPKDISNIFHLVNQRVVQQNDGSLIHLSIKVVYNDGTSVTHNSVQHFEEYYPTADTMPIEVVISFTYLIRFAKKEVPEKQEIEVIVSVDDRRVRESGAWVSGGVFEYRILHTDRTWSSDVANVLKNHSTNFMDKSLGFWKWMNRNEDDLFDYVFWLVLFGFGSYSYFSIKDSFFSSDTSGFDYSFFFEHAVSLSYIFLCLIVFLQLVEKFALYRFFVRRVSFITLIDKDYKKMKKSKASLRMRSIAFFLSVLINIGAGVVASFVYGYFVA